MAPQYFDLRTHDWLELLSVKLAVEGLTIADLPDADEPDFLLVVEELGFTNAIHRMKLRKAVREIQVADASGSEDQSPRKALSQSPRRGCRGQTSPQSIPRSLNRSKSNMSCDLHTVNEDPEHENLLSPLQVGQPVSGTGGTTEPGLSPRRVLTATEVAVPSMKRLSRPESDADILGHKGLGEEPVTLPSTPRWSCEVPVHRHSDGQCSRDVHADEEVLAVPIATGSTTSSNSPVVTSASAMNLHELGSPKPFQEWPTFTARSKSLSPIRNPNFVRVPRAVAFPPQAQILQTATTTQGSGPVRVPVPVSRVVMPTTMVMPPRTAAPVARAALPPGSVLPAAPTQVQVRLVTRRQGSLSVLQGGAIVRS